MSRVPYDSRSNESVSHTANCQDKTFIVSATLSLLPPWIKCSRLSVQLLYIAPTFKTNIWHLHRCLKCKLKGAPPVKGYIFVFFLGK